MTLFDLRPTEKLSVYELLGQLDFNLESWTAGENGRPIANPAVNGRAYAWSFEDPGSEQHVFMLWYEEMEEVGQQVRYRHNWSSVVSELERTRPRTSARADSFLRHVSRLKIGSIIRVGVVEGSRSLTTDEDPSRVLRRTLDPEPWHLSFWEPTSNTFEFTRGVPKAVESTGIAAVAPIDWEQRELDIEAIQRADISSTERSRLISARLGQGRFREEVLARWGNACAVTGCSTLAAIRASHCKPWRSSSHRERLDAANGLPLVATLDALFDTGLITFEDDGRLLVSSLVDDPTLLLQGLRLRRPLRAEECSYLAYHRRELFVA
jgi:hypothetical protein